MKRFGEATPPQYSIDREGWAALDLLQRRLEAQRKGLARPAGGQHPSSLVYARWPSVEA